MKTLEMKRQDAADRAQERSTLSPEEQLAILDTRIGSSAKERARLQQQIEKEKKS